MFARTPHLYPTHTSRVPSRLWTSIALVLLCLGISSGFLLAEPIRFNQLSVQDGLSDSRAHCIHQDRTGYMWFGTDDGLNRYDGREIRVFRPNDWAPGVRYVVSSIHEDADGFLWLGEVDTSFSKFDPASGTFLARHRYESGAPNDAPYSTHVTIRAGPAGTLWIGTGWIGLLQFDPSSGSFTHFPHREPAGDSTPRDGIYTIYSSQPDSELAWVGTMSSGLLRLDVTTGKWHRISDDPAGTHAVAPPDAVRFIGEAPESPRILLVGSYDGRLYRFDALAGKFLSVDQFGKSKNIPAPEIGFITGAIRDDEGRIWAASQNAGLAEFRAGEGFFNHQRHIVHDPKSLGNDLITDAYRDRGGVIWLATNKGGVSFFDPRASWIQHHYLKDEDGEYLNSAFVQAFHQDEANPEIVWLGSGAGLTRWNRRLDQYKTYRPPPREDLRGNANEIRSLSARRQGGFWIGSRTGLSRYDPTSDQIILENPPAAIAGGIDDFARGSIRSLYEDRQGELWIGLLPASGQLPGLIRYNPESGEVRAYRHEPSNPHSIEPGWITDIHEDSNGRMWFSSRMGGKGLSTFDRETDRFTHYQHDPAIPESIRDNAVRTFHEDREGEFLWVGTRSGLDRIAIGQQDVLGEVERIPASATHDILGIEQDAAGQLWLASKSGLRLLPDDDAPRLGTAVVAPQTAHRFQQLNDSYIMLSTGELLIGSKTGFFEIQPERFESGTPPPVVITELSLTGTGAGEPEGVELDSSEIFISHGQNGILEFNFAALDFSNPGMNRFTWRLEGLEDDWREISNTYTATYTTLPAGDYVFRVKATNGRDAWNEDGASLAFTVLPPWWANWWFRGAALTVFATGVFGMFRIRGRARRARILTLEEEAAQREALNQKLDASDRRFQSFITNSSEHLWCVEFDQPIPLDLPEMEQVERILDQGIYVEVNEAFARAYGATADEVIGWHLEKTLSRNLPSTIPFLQEVIRSGYRMEDVETIEAATDGSERIILNNFVGTIEHGKVIRVWGTARDVTERRKIEEQIKLRSASIETMSDACLIVDAQAEDLPVVYVNKRFAEITGYPESEVLGKNCRFLQGEKTSPESLTGIREAIASGLSFQGEILNYRKDGSPFWNFLRISPVHAEDGSVTHFVGTQSDITERKEAEATAQEQRNQLAYVSRLSTMGELTAAFAHELNQPLAAILRNAQAAQRFLALDEPDLQEVREIVTDIVSDDKRAANVLNRIRGLVTKDQEEYEKVNINTLVSDTVRLMHSDLLLKHMAIIQELSGTQPVAFADPVQLQQVLINLIINAGDAMVEAEVEKPKAVIATEITGSQMIQISVSDCGPGVPEENLKQLFTPFYTTKETGMGMGLTINRTIIEAHGGRMWAENLPAGGARLCLEISSVEASG